VSQLQTRKKPFADITSFLVLDQGISRKHLSASTSFVNYRNVC